MKKLKTVLSAILIFSAFISLLGCSKASYRDNLKTSELADKIISVNSDWNFTAMTDSYLEGAMKLTPSDFADYTVMVNALGTNVDEFGVFKAGDSSSVEAVKKAVEGYLSFRLETWMEEYMPEEKPKLEKAEVKVCGLYVMYAILDDTLRKDAFNSFETALKN